MVFKLMISWWTRNENWWLYVSLRQKQKNITLFESTSLKILHILVLKGNIFYSVFINCDFLYIIQKENTSVECFSDAWMHILNMELQEHLMLSETCLILTYSAFLQKHFDYLCI